MESRFCSQSLASPACLETQISRSESVGTEGSEFNRLQTFADSIDFFSLQHRVAILLHGPLQDQVLPNWQCNRRINCWWDTSLGLIMKLSWKHRIHGIDCRRNRGFSGGIRNLPLRVGPVSYNSWADDYKLFRAQKNESISAFPFFSFLGSGPEDLAGPDLGARKGCWCLPARIDFLGFYQAVQDNVGIYRKNSLYEFAPLTFKTYGITA